MFGFAALGLGLEALHGFKVGAYLDPPNETRRLMWTLAHAHGTLLGLVHIVFALTLKQLPQLPANAMRLASRGLVGASIFLPAGFFLGGVRFYAGDPGLGIVLVPVGAVLLLAALWQIAQAVRRTSGRPPSPTP